MFLKFKSNKENDFHSFSDEELIHSYKKSRKNLFIGELFERYTHLVFGVCMKYLKSEENSKDALMEIFKDLHLKLIDHDVSNFKSWIYSVSKNHCLMILRKEKHETKIKEEVFENFQQDFMESLDLFHPINKENLNDKIPKLKKGIELLKKEQRACIELLYLQNKSYKEVAEITGYGMKKVKSHIQNGKRNLKIYLEEK